jgi:cytochrome c oxidase assembly protein subunit 15
MRSIKTPEVPESRIHEGAHKAMNPDAARNTPRYWMNRVASASVVVVLAIMLSSAYLRQSSLRAGCPEWPACVQPSAGAVDATAAEGPVNFARLVHRLSASIAGAAVLLLALLSWVQTPRNRADLALSVALLAVTSFLAVLGRWSGAASPSWVTLGNLLGGMALIALLHWMQLRSAPAPATSGDRHGAALPGTALALSFAAVALGAVVGPQASTAGTGLPGLAHGFCGLLVLLLTAIPALVRRTVPPSARASILAAFALACALTLTGWISTRFGYPLPAALVHNLLAALLLLSLVTVTYRCMQPHR